MKPQNRCGDLYKARGWVAVTLQIVWLNFRVETNCIKRYMLKHDPALKCCEERRQSVREYSATVAKKSSYFELYDGTSNK